ncbi:hypothetical protein CQW23_08543 [Capsicum baccatum]|uniref:Uncharacterized protein n=1 Tax=Capsicum baccatum TaxID=33114 RepID=A0A2G2X9Q4_CAPBA|nr:hypothetical protein CQW23_08543 [Capsicum baccatum]
MVLNLAIKMKVTQLAVATDFKKLAMTLNEYGITERDTDEINLISIYRDLVEQMRNPPVHHEKWSMNVIADMLAKEGTIPIATCESQCKETGDICLPHKGTSVKRFLNHTTSCPVNSRAMNSDSMVERAIQVALKTSTK